jgi:hypothetical protein
MRGTLSTAEVSRECVLCHGFREFSLLMVVFIRALVSAQSTIMRVDQQAPLDHTQDPQASFTWRILSGTQMLVFFLRTKKKC